MRKSHKKDKKTTGKQWKKVIDFTKIKSGGVNINIVLSQL